MKPSKYNFIWPAEHTGKMIIYNSMTGGLMEIEKTCIDLLSAARIDYNSLSPAGKQFIGRMKQGSFVIDDVVDELSILKILYNSNKYNRSKLSLTIAPTMGCNFDCTYCYQHPGEGEEPRDDNSAVMPETVQQALLEFITNRANTLDSLQISWYGGEPLLQKDLIFALSKKMIYIARQNKIVYSAKMITNGYLIAHDPKIIQKLKESKITSLQITLDGPPEVHNGRRMLKGSHQPTFDRILQGIKLLAGEGFQVTLRINTDKSNMQDIEKLLELLNSNNLNNVQVYLGFIHPDTPGCNKCNILTVEQARQLNINFYQAILLKHPNIEKPRFYPKLFLSCGAGRMNAYTISPDGDMYKCWHEIGRKEASIGNITNFKTRSNSQRIQEIRWLSRDPFVDDHCRECKMLPICMGGCGYPEIVSGQREKCNPLDDHIEHLIKLRCCQVKS